MRGTRQYKRDIKPDAKYNSEVVAKFINYVMQDGKKETATKIVYGALDLLESKAKMPAIEALDKVLENVKPKVEVRSKRVGGSNYQVPVQVPEGRQLALAFKWIIESARKARKGDEFYIVLGHDLLAAFKGEGNAVKKKEEVKKMAEANKAFAQFS